jgi:hypothetical protein
MNPELSIPSLPQQFVNNLFLRVRHLAAFLVCSFTFVTGFALGQNFKPSEYLPKMPEVNTVLNYFHSEDEFDVKAKQSAALEILYDFICTIADKRVKEKNQGGNLWLSDQEKALNAKYSNASTEIIMKVYDQLDPGKEDRFKENSPCDLWRQKKVAYLTNEAFVVGLLSKYQSTEISGYYYKIIKARYDEYMNSPEYKQRLKEKEASQDVEETNEKMASDKSSFAIKKYSFIFLIAFFLLFLIPRFIYTRNKVFEFNGKKLATRNREFELHSVTGNILKSSKMATTQVYSTPGTYNSSTNTHTSSTVHSTTTIHDQIFLVDTDGKEHAIRLAGWDIAAREDNNLTMIWAIKKGQKSGPYIFALNHSTDLKYHMDRTIRKMFMPHWKRWYGITFLVLLFLLPIIMTPYLNMRIREFSDPNSLNESSVNLALYFSVYLWSWGLALIGFIIAFSVANGVAQKRTNELVLTIKFQDYK